MSSTHPEPESKNYVRCFGCAGHVVRDRTAVIRPYRPAIRLCPECNRRHTPAFLQPRPSDWTRCGCCRMAIDKMCADTWLDYDDYVWFCGRCWHKMESRRLEAEAAGWQEADR